MGRKTHIDACISVEVLSYIASDWSLDFRKLNLGPPRPKKYITASLDEKRKIARSREFIY
jgi:hypothetical protein